MKLAQEGVKKIAIHYRTGRSDSEKTLSLIEAAGASGVLVQGDVADPVAAKSLVIEAAQKLGGCDIFIQSVVPRLERSMKTRWLLISRSKSGNSPSIRKPARFSFVLELQRSS